MSVRTKEKGLTAVACMCTANGISLLRRGKGRLQACRFSQTIHIVRAFLQAFLHQMQQVRRFFPIFLSVLHTGRGIVNRLLLT